MLHNAIIIIMTIYMMIIFYKYMIWSLCYFILTQIVSKTVHHRELYIAILETFIILFRYTFE
jgi:hypothetical protein